MGVNKFVYGDEVKFDLTGDTVTPETLALGVTAHDAAGEPIVGRMTTEGGAGGESVSNIMRVTFDFDLSTLQAGNASHSAIEIFNAHENGAIVQGVLNFVDPDTGAPAQILMTPTLVINAQFAYVVELSVVAIIDNTATLINVQLLQIVGAETEISTFVRFLSFVS